MERLKKNDIVQSFKREMLDEVEQQSTQYLYQVLDVAIHSETEECMVIYKALYPPYDTWVRPYEMFMGRVEREKYPEIKQEFRFEKVEEGIIRKLVLVQKKEYNYSDLLRIIEILRSDKGCPWDKKQTFESMKKCLSDESEEVFEAIDKNDMDNLCEELGDVLLQVVMNGQIGKELQLFEMKDIIQGVSEKLIRRHPHVFGEQQVDNPEEALLSWKKVKELEKNHKK